MKRTILILLIFPLYLYSQDKAIINDPDGYTNVRNQPAGNVIDKIYEYEILLCSQKRGAGGQLSYLMVRLDMFTVAEWK